jgi:Leucine-rich repeat (LRR) protein
MKKRLALLCLITIVSLQACGSTIKDTLSYISWDASTKVEDPLTVKAIDFTKYKLDSLPKTLARFTNLKGLRLSKNHLSHLPDFIKTFKSLEYLYLNKNKFEVFPHQVFHLKYLKVLDVSKNKLTNIPEGIKSLQKLIYFDIWANQIDSFPKELALLQQLEFFDARGRTYSPSFVESWLKKLPNTTIKFEKPCDCLE